MNTTLPYANDSLTKGSVQTNAAILHKNLAPLQAHSVSSENGKQQAVNLRDIPTKWLKTVCILLVANFFFIAGAFAQTNYYYDGSGNINSRFSWGTNTDGSGSNPSNFTSNNRTYNIRNTAAVSLNGTWTVSGTGTKIVVGDGTNACNFTVGGTLVLTATTDVSANATLTLSTTGSITGINFGTLAASSTVNFASTSSQTIPNDTWGNIIISGSKGNNDVTFAAGMTIAGSLTITATGNSGSGFVFFNTTNTDRNFTISGDYTQSGAIDVEFGSGNGHSYIALGGDLSKSAGYMVTTGNTENGRFTMSGSNVTMQSNGGTESKWMDFIIASGSVCTLNGQFNYFGSSGTNANFTINSGGRLNCGSFNVVTAGGFANFTNNGTLGIGSSAGITSAGGTGNIQTTTRTFSTAGFYVYNGTTQATGSGLPTTAITGGVTISSGATVTTTNAIIVNTTGVLAVDGILIPGAATQVMSGTGTLNGSGTVRVNRTAATADFLSQYTQTTKTLTSLTVEYTVTTGSQVVSATTYNNLILNNTSGTNTSGGSVTVNGTLTLAAGGAFAIGSNTHTFNGAVSGTGTLTGSNTSNLVIGGAAGTLRFTSGSTNNFLRNFTLNTGATATLGNALNITAFDGTSSEGVLTVTGTATLTTGGFLTIKSNANGTARIAAGRTSGGYISGNVSVERFIPQNSSKGWRLLASTTSGQTINAAWQEGQNNSMNNPNPGFGTKITAGNTITTNLATARAAGFDTLSAGVSLFKYNAATDVLETVTATNTGNIASEQGYFLFIRGHRAPGQFGAGAPSSSTVLRSNGSLFLGDQTAVATGTSNYGLVRNPYPSRIDMRNIVRGSNLIDAYQVWDAKLGGTFGVGGFQTFSKSGANYIVSPGGGSYGANGSIHNFIESGAAFFIQSTTNTNNTAQVTEACKTSASNTNSFRPNDVQADEKRITFTLRALNPGSADVVDGGLVFFDNTYSNSVTVEDVRKSGNFNENFGILRDNVDLVVEKRKDVAAGDTVFFKMYQLRQISYRIDFESLNFIPGVNTVILQDKFTNTNTTLDLTALTSYTFTVSGTAGSFAQNRFRLVLAASSNTFSGAGNWSSNERWSRGVPPSAGETVIIAAGANATLDTDYTVAGSLTMAATSSLEVLPTKTLTVSGSADFAGQSVTFRSDETGYGSLGQVTGTLNGATNVTIERYIPNNGFRSWRLLSVPTYGNGQTIRQAWQEGIANPLALDNNLPNRGTQITGVFATQAAAAAAGFDAPSAQGSLLTWNGAGWSNVNSTNSPIANNKAYFLYIRGERSKGVTGAVTNASATTLRTNGTAYTGNQVVSVPTGGLSLVSNLYPSAINFTALTRSNVNNVFYIWDSKKQNGNSLGVYQTFSGINSYNCLISGGSYTLGQPNTIIESGQAFFVSGGVTPGGGTITLLESAKVSSSGNLGFRPAAIPAKIESRLLDANNEVLDANVVIFDNAYSKTVDTDDAPKFGNPGANFAIEKASKILAIEGTRPVEENDVIQFRTWNLKQQVYTLEFTASKMNAVGLYAILEDTYLKESTEIDLKKVSTISFTVNNDPASAGANRFRMRFSKVKPVTSLDKPAYSIAPNPVEGHLINLLFKNQPEGRYHVKLTGFDGKTLAGSSITHAAGTANHVMSIPVTIAAGNYQLEINGPNNKKSVQQVTVNGQ